MPRTYGTTNAAPYASAPTIGPAGDTYYNTTEKRLYLSDGSVWNPDAAAPAPNGVPAGGTQDQVLQKNSATDYDDAWTSTPGANGGISAVTATGNNAFGTFNGQRINGTAAMGPVQNALNFRGMGWDGVSAYRVLGSVTVGSDANAVSPTDANGTCTFSTTQRGTLANTARLRMDSLGLIEMPGKLKIGQPTAQAGLTGSVLDLSNGLLNMRRQAITLVNGANNDITIPTSSFVEFTGPTAAFSLSGIAGGIDGAIVNWIYLGTQPIQIVNQATSVAANQINTVPSNYITTKDEYTVGPCAGTLIYNANSSKWMLVDMMYGGYKPFQRLARASTTTAVSGIGTGGSTILSVPAIYIPANRTLEIVAHITVGLLNNGAFCYARQDASPIAGRIATTSTNSAGNAISMNGTAITTPPAGSHSFDIVLASLSSTVNLDAATDMSWFEVWDRGAS